MINVEKEKIDPGKECPIPSRKYSLGERQQVCPPMEATAARAGSAHTATVWDACEGSSWAGEAVT